MKWRFALLIVCLMLGLPGIALAQVGAFESIDETNPIVSLHFPTLAGPLFICEGPLAADGTCGSNVNISDELSFVFTDPATQIATAMCLFSDPINAFQQPGTQEFPDNSCPGSGLQANFAYITETRNPDGSETMNYTPGPGQAGFTSAVAMTYFITSDSAGEADVPEPGSLALLGTGLLGFVGAVRRKWLQ